MGIVSGILVFVMIWWSVIFCILPIGQSKTFEEIDEGNEDYRAPGSPRVLDMKKKLLITTVTSIVLWVIAYAFIESNVINFREMAKMV